ncbi:MAG: M42 family metallopeptidase [Clostridia bacterium]|nr:M42 family metallopeptidase [Clostridia bacterium]
MLELLEKLVVIPAPSGREHKLAAAIAEMMTPYADTVRIDALGNVIAKINGCGPDDKKKKLMFSAHMDEVSYMVTKIEENGYLRIVNIGGPHGVGVNYSEFITDKGIHCMIVPVIGKDGSWSPDDKVVDIGASSREEAEKVILPGDTLTMRPTIIHSLGDTYSGHPVDNRIGCAIEISAAMQMKEKRPYNDVFFVFSVQEEINGNGGLTAAYAERPDFGIAIDVCGTGDCVGSQPMIMKLGGGAAIKIKDSTIMCDWPLCQKMMACAEKNEIPYQREILLAGGTDATAMQKVAAGIPAGCISIPMRYLHSPAETFNMKDAEACRDLTVKLANEEF